MLILFNVLTFVAISIKIGRAGASITFSCIEDRIFNTFSAHTFNCFMFSYFHIFIILLLLFLYFSGLSQTPSDIKTITYLVTELVNWSPPTYIEEVYHPTFQSKFFLVILARLSVFATPEP